MNAYWAATGMWPLGHIEVTFSKFLRRYQIAVIAGKVIAGSREGLDHELFELNKRVRPKRRGLRNPSRSTRRTDFGWRIEQDRARSASNPEPAKEDR